MDKHHILQQHMPYEQMLSKALDFCEVMLVRSPTLYPFALLNACGQIDCVFSLSSGQLAPSQMIESLQTQINEQKNITPNSTNLLVYSAKITYPNSTDTDVLVFTVTDTQGHNSVIIYPYKQIHSGIKINQPYTCDFSD